MFESLKFDCISVCIAPTTISHICLYFFFIGIKHTTIVSSPILIPPIYWSLLLLHGSHISVDSYCYTDPTHLSILTTSTPTLQICWSLLLPHILYASVDPYCCHIDLRNANPYNWHNDPLHMSILIYPTSISHICRSLLLPHLPHTSVDFNYTHADLTHMPIFTTPAQIFHICWSLQLPHWSPTSVDYYYFHSYRPHMLILLPHIQSTLVISKSKGLSEILRDIRSSTYHWDLQNWGKNKPNNHN